MEDKQVKEEQENLLPGGANDNRPVSLEVIDHTLDFSQVSVHK